MTNRRGKLAAIAALLFILSPSSFAQPRSTDRWKATDLLPLTCAQAWQKADKQKPQMLSIVITLARVSLANRDLTFPNTRDAGTDAGQAIAEDCKADPDSLLFAIVDKHVRRVAQTTTTK